MTPKKVTRSKVVPGSAPSPDGDRPVIGVAFPKPDYLKSIERAGGDPLVLKPERDVLPDALDQCDGVLLTGGADIDPARYGEIDRHSSVEIDATRDEYEVGLTQLALERQLPLLAICRGAQLLNVVAGGTLVQDIPSSLPSPVTHRRAKPARVKKTRAHDVALVPGTRTARLLETAATRNGQVPVNSRHHQSVKQIAPGFVVSATAPDGIVEAIERAGRGFCVGVQWHPENYWRTGEFSQLFEGLVEAAAERRRTRT
jgi:putative glutamine amidotransferase